MCLTQEQLQQILNSIKASAQNVQEDDTAHNQNGESWSWSVLYLVLIAALCKQTFSLTGAASETVTSETGDNQEINSGKENEEK